MLVASIALLSAWMPTSAWAADSYRWFHVTIDTPWAIFIFLLPLVVAPLVLLVIMYWRFAFHPPVNTRGRRRTQEIKDAEPSSAEPSSNK